MSPDAWMVFGLLALAVGLFISERVPLGLAALLIAGLLMAGVIPLGLAMGKTGATQVLAGQVTATLGTYGRKFKPPALRVVVDSGSMAVARKVTRSGSGFHKGVAFWKTAISRIFKLLHFSRTPE